MNIKEAVFTWVAVKFYFPYSRIVYRQDQRWLSMDRLSNCASGTLGNELYLFFLQNGLKLISGSEDHDIKHVLLSYSITFKEEMCMQFFQFGNGNRSIPVWLLILSGPLVTPHHISLYRQAYLRGKRARPMPYTGLTAFIDQSLNQLQEQWNITSRT